MVIFPPETRPYPATRHQSGPARSAVFFDRDDTLIENATLPPEALAGKLGDLADPAWVRPLPGAADACRRARELGYAVIIVTNQGVVARGGATLAQVEATCQRTLDLLGPGIEAGLACPFHPQANGPAEFCREHDWRKPQPGMLLAAAELFNLDLAHSWMVGDAQRDIDAGLAAGLPQTQCLLVGNTLDLTQVMDRIAQTPAPTHG
ncbi:MAG: HAD-IIIA family hydrolase [Phycisphaera sp.]|nr:MAG: HAD-IIIA family hydrolase [Phycisphaera sp.]